MYPVPPSAATYGATETHHRQLVRRRPGAALAHRAGHQGGRPVARHEWVRNGSADVSADDIVASCDDSLKRLQTDVIDLYQIHWPTRNVPMFGACTSTRPRTAPSRRSTSSCALAAAGARRARCAMSGCRNETPWGVAEFVRLADAARAAAHRHRAERLQPDQSLGRQRPGRGDAALPGVAAGLFAAGLRPADRQVRRRRLRRPGRAAGASRSSPAMRKQRWGRARGAGRGAPLQRAGARARPDADAHGAGLLLPQLARGQHHHRRDHAWRSSTRTSTPGARRCRPSCWRPSTDPLGTCATRRSDRAAVAMEGTSTSARRRPRSGCAGTASPSPSTSTTTSTTAAPPNRRASSAWTSMRWSRRW